MNVNGSENYTQLKPDLAKQSNVSRKGKGPLG
jgi:hypothetical protein